MAAILHDTVGLLHGSLGIFLAYIDRAPVLVLGGAGPMDTARRRPWIDWVHTSNIQGNAVRSFTKWDDQPASVAAMPEAFARATSILRSEPAGPVYLALDAGPAGARAGERGARLPGRRHAPDAPDRAPTPRRSRSWPTSSWRPNGRSSWPGSPAATRGPSPGSPSSPSCSARASSTTASRLNLPTTHPTNVTGTTALQSADLVLLLDLKDASRVLLTTDPPAREARSTVAPDCRIVDLGFNDAQVSAWVHAHGAAHRMDLRITADTSVALPLLLASLHARLTDEAAARRARREARRAAVAELHAERRAQWSAVAAKRHDERPISPSRLAAEVGRAIEGHDWVLTAGTANDWAPAAVGLRPALPPSRRGAWAPRRRSACRWGSRSPIAARAGWWWTCSRTAT